MNDVKRINGQWKCKNYKHYKGLRPPRCGCEWCKAKYRVVQLDLKNKEPL